MISRSKLTEQHRNLIAIILIICSLNRLMIGLWENQILNALSCVGLLILSALSQNALAFADLGWVHLQEKYSKKKGMKQS